MTSPTAVCTQNCPKTIVFVPVDGRIVFLVCLMLIAFCVIWLFLLCTKGVKFEEKQ